PAWTVRALSVPGPDTELSLFVSFDDARFLFGAGEAMQRSLVQKRLSLRKLQAVFLPSGRSGRGGLAGGLMTLSDAGIKRLAIIGPPDTAQHLATLRASVVRDSQTVDLKPVSRELSSEVVFSSPRITVHAVTLRPPQAVEQGSANPQRPSELSEAELSRWTTAIVNDMFRGPGSDQTIKDEARFSFNGLYRPTSADDRYPLPLASDADVATDVCYIVRTPDVRGKFDVAKAKALGVPNGPIRGKLTRGESIEFEDPSVPGVKRIVHPEQCIGGGGPGSTLVVINCSVENLERLLLSTAFGEFRAVEGKPSVPVHSVVHAVPRAVWMDERYQAWVASFGPSTQHLYADPEGTREIYFRNSAWNALQLNMLDSSIFPIPDFAPGSPPPHMPANAQRLVPNHVVPMYPPKPVFLTEDHMKDTLFPADKTELAEARAALRRNHPEYAAAVDAAQAAMAADADRRACLSPRPGDDIVVTTLGTGSAIPSIFRNVSCTHVDIPGTGGVIFDTGEGSLGQLRRRFGDGLKQVYEDLRLIFISHMHADHHLGLAQILKDRFDNGVHSKLYLVAPYPIALQLEETAWWQQGVPREALENVVYLSTNRLKSGWVPDEREFSLSARPDWSSVPRHPEQLVTEEGMVADVAAGKRKWPFENVFRFHPATNARAAEHTRALLRDLRLSEIWTPNVTHRGAAWGMVLSGVDGWKVVYSGDTKPSEALVDAGRGATVLIHEATLGDDEAEDAEAKGHSTFGQAIEAGRRMGARYVILNHFSQRYPKIPKLPAPEPVEEGGEVHAPAGPTVAISFDFMSLRVADTWKMSHFTEPLNMLYAEAEE
ncbi:Metallo-hydrolase/oxidoreductase, partial [Cutaneotrichosporon oleaginosum]